MEEVDEQVIEWEVQVEEETVEVVKVKEVEEDVKEVVKGNGMEDIEELGEDIKKVVEMEEEVKDEEVHGGREGRGEGLGGGRGVGGGGRGEEEEEEKTELTVQESVSSFLGILWNYSSCGS